MGQKEMQPLQDGLCDFCKFSRIVSKSFISLTWVKLISISCPSRLDQLKDVCPPVHQIQRSLTLPQTYETSKALFFENCFKEGDAVFGNHGLGKIHLSSPEVTNSFC